MRTLSLTDDNRFYAPATDECWVMLAKAIMSSYSISYINLIPTTARSQMEYDELDQKKYAPQRKSVLRRVKYGPLKSMIDIDAVYSAFERQRKDNLKTWGIHWVDRYNEDLSKL